MPNSQDQQSVRTAVQTEQIAAAVGQQTAMLRTVLERLDELVQLLTPPIIPAGIAERRGDPTCLKR